MSTKTWTAEDAAPKDWPVVVGPDGVTYGHDAEAEAEGYDGLWVRQEIKHLPEGGATYGPMGLEFREIFDDYEVGAVVREATDEEARTWTETWLAGRSS